MREDKDDEPEHFTLLLSVGLVIGGRGDGDASSWWWHWGLFSVAKEFGFKAVHLEHTVRTRQIAWGEMELHDAALREHRCLLLPVPMAVEPCSDWCWPLNWSRLKMTCLQLEGQAAVPTSKPVSSIAASSLSLCATCAWGWCKRGFPCSPPSAETLLGVVVMSRWVPKDWDAGWGVEELDSRLCTTPTFWEMLWCCSETRWQSFSSGQLHALCGEGREERDDREGQVGCTLGSCESGRGLLGGGGCC